MSDRENCFQGRRVLFAAAVSAITLAVGVGRSTSQTSEIDSYETAVRSQSKVEALSFIKNFDSSHLVGDLIESLPPEVAQQVCTDLQGSGPARARKACEVLRKAFAVQPDAQTAAIAPAAGGAVVASIPTRTSASVSSDDEPEDVQDAVNTDKAGDTDLSTVPAAGIAAVEPVTTDAATPTSVPSDHEPQGGQDASDPDNASDADLVYAPIAAAAPANDVAAVTPVSTRVVTATSAPPADETRGHQDAGDADNASDAALFYIPVAAATPVGDIAAPASTGEVTSTSAHSDEEPRGGQGTSDTDKSDDINIILQTTAATPAVRSTPFSSMSISTSPASTSIPSGDEPDTQSSSDQSSSDQSSSDQSGSDKSDTSKNAEEKAAEEKATKETEKATKEAEKTAKEKGDKGKGGKGKGGKGKGGKGKGGKGKGSG
jgi:hypothetical protein